MEPTINTSRNVYTRERLISIRNHTDLSRYLIPNSVISLDPEKRLSFRKTRPLADPAVLQVKSSKNTDSFYSGTMDISGGNGDTTPYSLGWRRTRRTSTGTPQSPLETPSQRHNSGSSGGEDNYGGGNKSSVVRREFDWTLGCGKWRHRSTSGSEVGVHKSTFYVSGGRGRGRGTENAEFHRQQSGGGSSGARGRGFTHRPFQHVRGVGGFKPSTPFNNHGADHGPTIQDFEPQCEHHQHYHPYLQYPYPPHQGVPRQFHKDVSADNTSQRDEMRWDHDTMSPTQPPQMPSSLSTKEYSAENVLQPSLLPPSLPQTEQIDEVVPIMSESIAKPLDKDSVIKPTKVFSFMSNLPSRPLVESQAQVAPLSQFPPQIPQSGPTLWYYRDPSGNVRGPFDDSTMATWFSAGYFSVQIEVRRECDRVFSTITDYIAMLNRFPFVGSSDLPPILEHRSPAVSASTLPLPPHLVGVVPQAPLPTPIPSLFAQQMSLLQSPLLQTSLAPPSTAPLVTALQPPQVPTVGVVGQPSLVDPNQASMNIVNVDSLAKVALSEIVRLQKDAQCLCDRFSALGVDRSALAKSLATLGLGAAETTTTPAPMPPNIINLQQLEETIHKRQQEEDEQLKRQQQPQQTTVKDISLPSLPVQEMETLQVAKKQEKSSQPVPPPLKKQSSRKDKNVKLDQPSEPPVEKEPPTLKVPTTTTKKKRKKSKSVTMAASAENVIEAEIITALAVTPAPGASLEPEDDWIAVPSMEATLQAPVVQQEQKHQRQPKKKKKSKLTAEELRQQAWEQEEQRRRRANEERIAQMEAEEAAEAAAAEAEEAQLAAIAAAKAKEDAELLLQRRKVREAAMRGATAKPAHIGLPSTSCWGSASSNGGAAATPSMTDIFALQMQEEECERSKAAPTTTFAFKVASGGSPSFTAASAPTNKTKKVAAPVEAPQKPNLSALKTPAAVNAAQVIKTGVISIWDLPTNNLATKSATSKNNNRKKKANASSHLIRGPIISLKPKARAELVRWCEGQLSSFPRCNVDIPTLISLVCDIEEAEDILECVESSFGKSQRVSKFSKAFVEKRANLMGTIV